LDEVCSGLDHVNEKLVYFGLLGVIALGVGIRLLPVFEVGGNWLADLDPYRNLRAVNKILESGRMPIFDQLSAAPNGTYATYATSQGYYMLSATLTLTSGVNSVQTLSISPILCEFALLLTVYAFGFVLTKSQWAGLAAAFFASLGQGWTMIGMVGTCPLAENFGVIIFILVLLLFWKYVKSRKKLFLILSGVILGISLLIHPITYFYLFAVLFMYAILLSLVQKKINGLKYLFKLFLVSVFAIAIQWSSIKNLTYAFQFSRGALWLATLQPIYPVIDFYVVLSEVGGLTFFLGLLGVMLIILDKRWEKLVVLSWVSVMLVIICLSLLVPLRLFLANFPFGAFLILSHRVMPYLHVALGLLSGLVIVEYIWPLVKDVSKVLNPQSSLNLAKIGILLTFAFFFASAPIIQSSISYATNYSSFAKWAQQYSSLSEWIRVNTKPNDVFIVNEIGLGEVLRVLAERPTVFTISYQDLVSSDLEKRMLLYSAVYIISYDDKLTQRLLFDFNVSYVIVIRDQYVVDILNKKYVYATTEESFPLYLKWLDEKPYLTRIYSDFNGQFYVYHVDREHLFRGEVAIPEVKP
jgi:hypothetical protein